MLSGFYVLSFADNESSLICEKCGEKFRYKFPYLAHLRFRCTKVYRCQTSSESISPTINLDHSMRETESENRTVVEESKGLKRSADTDIAINIQRKKLCLVTKEENNNEQAPSTSKERRISPCSGSHIGETEARDIGSAFRKVEKSITRESISSAEEIQMSNKPSYSIGDNKMTLQKEHEIIARHLYNKGMLPQSSMASRLPVGLGMLNPSWMTPVSTGTQAYLDPRVYSERVHVSAADKPEMTGSVNKLNHDSDIFSKQMLMDQLRKSHLPYVQTANPMVEKILQTATPTMLQRPIQTLSLAQNWCAKCNATFRMTSDLVYHMRSHHKREFDPIKKKREDKLQCSVCKETFKERHHLTRHMTSHT